MQYRTSVGWHLFRNALLSVKCCAQNYLHFSAFTISTLSPLPGVVCSLQSPFVSARVSNALLSNIRALKTSQRSFTLVFLRWLEVVPCRQGRAFRPATIGSGSGWPSAGSTDTWRGPSDSPLWSRGSVSRAVPTEDTTWEQRDQKQHLKCTNTQTAQGFLEGRRQTKHLHLTTLLYVVRPC